jgi:hypothetical protein
MQLPTKATMGLILLVLAGGCNHAKPPQVTANDIESAKQDAADEVAQARIEAKREVSSAAKGAGTQSAVVKEAKVTGSYDIAMVQAEGDHKVAVKKCLTLEAQAQKNCADQANADYEAAKASAKATRVSRQP